MSSGGEIRLAATNVGNISLEMTFTINYCFNLFTHVDMILEMA
jgi:hypothetical protein